MIADRETIARFKPAAVVAAVATAMHFLSRSVRSGQHIHIIPTHHHPIRSTSPSSSTSSSSAYPCPPPGINVDRYELPKIYDILCVFRKELEKYAANMMNVVILGMAGSDFVVTVKNFPSPDDKIRSECAHICGGGNAANTAVAVTRLGHSCELISKVGSDSNGEIILSDLNKENVGLRHCISSPTTTSAFTYVIVDITSTTRTCIHTPMTEEITQLEIESILSLINLTNSIVHFDSRHTQAAVQLAMKAADHGSNITTIDLEKVRPSIFDLLPLIDIIFTNLKCVDEFFPEGKERGLHRAALFLDQPFCRRCSLVVCTLGSGGSLLLYRADCARWRDLSGTKAEDGLVDRQWLPPLEGLLYADIPGSVCADSLGTFPLCVTEAVHWRLPCGLCCDQDTPGAVEYASLWCSPWPTDTVVDSTGAGDAYIGGFLAGLSNGHSLKDCLAIGSVVASMKLAAIGARAGLPSLETVQETIRSCSGARRTKL